MAGLTPGPLSLVAMDAVTGAQGHGLVLVQDPMVTGALAHHVLLRTVERDGKEQKEQGPIGQDHGLDPPVVFAAVALVVESHLLGICFHMN